MLRRKIMITQVIRQHSLYAARGVIPSTTITEGSYRAGSYRGQLPRAVTVGSFHQPHSDQKRNPRAVTEPTASEGPAVGPTKRDGKQSGSHRLPTTTTTTTTTQDSCSLPHSHDNLCPIGTQAPQQLPFTPGNSGGVIFQIYNVHRCLTFPYAIAIHF